MHDLNVILLEFETPSQHFVIVVGYPLDKSKRIVVCIYGNYPCPKIYAKTLTARTKRRASFSIVE